MTAEKAIESLGFTYAIHLETQEIPINHRLGYCPLVPENV